MSFSGKIPPVQDFELLISNYNKPPPTPPRTKQKEMPNPISCNQPSPEQQTKKITAKHVKKTSSEQPAREVKLPPPLIPPRPTKTTSLKIPHLEIPKKQEQRSVDHSSGDRLRRTLMVSFQENFPNKTTFDSQTTSSINCSKVPRLNFSTSLQPDNRKSSYSPKSPLSQRISPTKRIGELARETTTYVSSKMSPPRNSPSSPTSPSSSRKSSFSSSEDSFPSKNSFSLQVSPKTPLSPSMLTQNPEEENPQLHRSHTFSIVCEKSPLKNPRKISGAISQKNTPKFGLDGKKQEKILQRFIYSRFKKSLSLVNGIKLAPEDLWANGINSPFINKKLPKDCPPELLPKLEKIIGCYKLFTEEGVLLEKLPIFNRIDIWISLKAFLEEVFDENGITITEFSKDPQEIWETYLIPYFMVLIKDKTLVNPKDLIPQTCPDKYKEYLQLIIDYKENDYKGVKRLQSLKEIQDFFEKRVVDPQLFRGWFSYDSIIINGLPLKPGFNQKEVLSYDETQAHSLDTVPESIKKFFQSFFKSLSDNGFPFKESPDTSLSNLIGQQYELEDRSIFDVIQKANTGSWGIWEIFLRLDAIPGIYKDRLRTIACKIDSPMTCVLTNTGDTVQMHLIKNCETQNLEKQDKTVAFFSINVEMTISNAVIAPIQPRIWFSNFAWAPNADKKDKKKFLYAFFDIAS